jgi:neutral ceramidase
MKKLFKSFICIIPVVLMAGLLFSFRTEHKAAGSLKAGIAMIKITPDKPVRMSGYEARKDPFKGVHDDIYAGAVVFDNGETKTCLITTEIIDFSNDYTDEICAMINKATGIPAGNILVTTVHDHSAPMTRSYGDNLTDNEKEYVNTLKDKLVQVAKEANGKLQPVRIGAGKGTCTMNINRRAPQADGGVWLGRNPDGICDHEVGVIRIDDMSSHTIGILVNWPCHATTGGQENYQISGDWPGAARRDLEKEYGNAVVLISAGASGDINPIYGPNNSFSDMENIGSILAKEVKKVYSEIDPISVNDLKTDSYVIKAKGKKRSESRKPDVSMEPDGDVDVRICAMKVGNIIFDGINGELVNEVGLTVKKNSPFADTFVLSHCNGSSGYLVTDEMYKEGGYEPMVSRTMPGTAGQIIGGFMKLNDGF